MADVPDPFRDARRTAGVLGLPTDREKIPLILRHEDVRKAAKDWQTFSSDAPFRVPIPSEEHLRSVRQLPIETDPPVHTEYRELVEPFFLRAKQPAFIARVEAIVDRLLTQALSRDKIEAVGEFALPLQSRALTVLLDVPEAEAERFISWGVHVFHGEHGVRQAADEIRLDRRPNPHVAFGFGARLCLGAGQRTPERLEVPAYPHDLFLGHDRRGVATSENPLTNRRPSVF
jgi:cytochrome P450